MTDQQGSIAVLGAGSWGTALALQLARNHNPVRLWGVEAGVIAEMQQTRINSRYLPGFHLPENIEFYTDLQACLESVRDILLVVPSHAFREVSERCHAYVTTDRRIAWGTKGLDPKTCQLLHEVVADIFSDTTPAAALSGPSFALEVAANQPTAVSLAGNDSEFLADLLKRLHNEHFRVYQNKDLIGVQLCGTVKNILAIAAGIADGLQFGTNTRCALITRGLAELGRLVAAMGGRRETLLSLAGVGDLILTCTDDQSRNRRFGLAVGMGADTRTALSRIGQAVEGLQNTEQVYRLAEQHAVEMPIVTQMYRILYEGQSPREQIEALLARPPGAEG